MKYTIIFRNFLISVAVLILLFLLSFKTALYLVTNEVNSLLNSNQFKNEIYNFTVKSIVNFAEKEPTENDKKILKESISKIINNYKDVIILEE